MLLQFTFLWAPLHQSNITKEKKNAEVYCNVTNFQRSDEFKWYLSGIGEDRESLEEKKEEIEISNPGVSEGFFVVTKTS